MDIARSEAQSYWDTVPLNSVEAESTRLGGRDPQTMAGYAKFSLPRRSLLKTVSSARRWP
jgi:hypothetical protein